MSKTTVVVVCVWYAYDIVRVASHCFFLRRGERGGIVFLLRGESRDVLFYGSENIYGLALDVELL
jgi:hypothetical protein